MSSADRAQVAGLHEALPDKGGAKQIEASEALRTAPIKAIIPPPEGHQLMMDVRGDLAGILAIATQQEPLKFGLRGLQFELGAGTGFEPVTFRL